MGTKVLIRILLVLMILCAAYNLPAQEEDDEATPPPKKAGVQFVGNQAFGEKELLEASGLRLPESHIFRKKLESSAGEVEEAVNELTVFYKRQGYFDVSIKKEEREDKFAVIIFEGPAYRISSLEIIRDAQQETAAELVSAVTEKLLMKPGGPFRVADYEAAPALLEKEFGDAGFPFVKASPSALVDVAAKEVAVKISVNTGQHSVFGPVTFEGIIHAEEAMLRKLLKFREGEPYSASALDEAKDAFYKTGLFDIVTIKVRQADASGEVPIHIILKEGRHRKVKLAVGYGSDEKFRFQAGWETLRLGGRYVNAGFNLKRSHLETTGEAHFRRPYFIERYTLFSVARLSRLNWIQTDFDDLSFSAGLERKFGKDMIVTAEAVAGKIEKIEFTSPVPRVAPDSLKPWTLSLRLSAVRNTTDNPLDPSSGYILQGSVEPGTVAGAGVNFAKLSAELRAFRELKDDHVLAFRLKTASLMTGSPIGRIPYPYRFFTGGQMKLRGYSFSSVSPQDGNGSLKGGLGLVESSLEYRFPVKGDFKGLVFFDAGKATRDSFPLANVKHLSCGAGFGVRYMTAVGPVGMDVAYRLSEAPYSSANYQVALFIGYAF